MTNDDYDTVSEAGIQKSLTAWKPGLVKACEVRPLQLSRKNI